MPRDPVELGHLLHGLGEINARTSAEFAAPLIQHLRTQRGRSSFLKVLEAAAECEAKPLPKPSLTAIDLAQWVSGAPLAWTTFDRAVHRIGHPDIGISPGRYGLGFVAKIIAALDPRALDIWIKRHPNRQRVATIASAALPSAFDPDIIDRATLLLGSRIPALKCLAAALYVCPIFPEPSLDDFPDCRRALVANGIDPGDATWMMAYRIKNAIHARYRTKHQLESAQARLRYLESNPEAAIGGRRNFDAEVRMLRNEVDRASGKLSKLAVDLEAMLADLAADWPADGLSDDQMRSLEYNFVSTPEIRHRLVEKLPPGSIRTALLKRDIEQLSEYIGLSKNPTSILNAYFNPDDNRFDIIAPWAAKSLIVLYADDHRGVGKRTSDLVSGMTNAFEALAAEPFVAARKPVQWQSAFGRAASAYIFALLVVAAAQEDRRSEVRELNRLALDHVFQLLCAEHPDVHSSQLLFKLTTRAVLQMSYSADGDARRRRWAKTKELPPFARALALWSSPALAEQESALAIELFRRNAEPPLSRSARDLQMSHMLTLLDLAIAACVGAAKPALVRDLVALWADLYQDWLPIVDRWINAAAMMSAALEREGAERTALLAEPTLTHSHCRLLIERQRAASGQSESAE